MTQPSAEPKPSLLQQTATIANLIYGLIGAILALGGVGYGFTQHLNAQDARLSKMEWEMSILLTLTDWRTKTDQSITLLQDQNEASIKDRNGMHVEIDKLFQQGGDLRDRQTRSEAKGR